MSTITNPWITLSEQRNGVNVQRKFAGLDTLVNENDEVTHCIVKYWYRELYPNNEPIKTTLRSYTLKDLAETVNDVEGWKQEPLPVLSGFIQALGMPGIVEPARETLENHIVLPIDHEEGYPLRRDTREKLPLE
jgi:hypothetical protein